jgi:short-subunit dehydrogenase
MKTVVITGTSQGLGFSLASFFIKNGWKVIGISRQSCSLKENYRHIFCDISNLGEVIGAITDLNNIDVLINNSAVFDIKDFSSTDISFIDKIIDTNLKGSMYVTHRLIPNINNRGKIIFINSVAGLRDIENQAIYCASKSGLRSFAGVIGKELHSRNIKVTSIHPGGIDTSLWNSDNPYPCGNASDAMPTEAISELVYTIASDDSNAYFKSVTVFPEIEWH